MAIQDFVNEFKRQEEIKFNYLLRNEFDKLGEGEIEIYVRDYQEVLSKDINNYEEFVSFIDNYCSCNYDIDDYESMIEYFSQDIYYMIDKMKNEGWILKSESNLNEYKLYFTKIENKKEFFFISRINGNIYTLDLKFFQIHKMLKYEYIFIINKYISFNNNDERLIDNFIQSRSLTLLKKI